MNAPAQVCLVDDDSSVLRSMQFLLASDGIAARAFNKSAADDSWGRVLEFFDGHLNRKKVAIKPGA